jgi:hypothetical protein
MGGVGDLKRFSGILIRLRVLSLVCTIFENHNVNLHLYGTLRGNLCFRSSCSFVCCVLVDQSTPHLDLGHHSQGPTEGR